MHFHFITSNHWVSWGGSEELWAAAALALAQSGFRVSVSVPEWPQQAWPLVQLANAGCQMNYRPRENNVRSNVRRLMGRGRLLAGVDESPDLVVISQCANFDGVDWMEDCQYRNLPYAMIVQAAAEQLWMHDPVVSRLRKGYQLAKMSYFVSNGNHELTCRQIGLRIEKWERVYNPFKVPYNDPPLWPSSPEELSLACVGRIHVPSKGQDLVLDALSREQWKNRSVSISFYGEGVHQKSVERLANLFNISNVSFHGFVHEIDQIWARHHALFLPSRYEGLPLAVVEAMLSNRPVIVTNVAGNSELVKDGVTGFIASAPHVDSVSSTLERVWQERNRLQEMGLAAGKAARKFVPENPGMYLAQRLRHLMGV